VDGWAHYGGGYEIPVLLSLPPKLFESGNGG